MGLRQERLADQIRDILAVNFQGGLLSDPRLSTVTITAVKLTADLQLATVYFRTYEDKDSPQAQRGLESAAGRLRRQLGQSIDLRRVPNLRFIFDKSLENAARIETLLTRIADEETTESASE
jgi:ribosome-binding factor A